MNALHRLQADWDARAANDNARSRIAELRAFYRHPASQGMPLVLAGFAVLFSLVWMVTP